MLTEEERGWRRRIVRHYRGTEPVPAMIWNHGPLEGEAGVLAAMR
jgi:hypothetical protein